jgi:hypothetical protein
MRFSMPLRLRNVSFARSARAFGDFKRETKAYAYDEKIHIYGEVVNFVNAPDGDEFLSEIMITASILNANGDIIKTVAGSRATRPSRSRLNDFHFIFTFKNKQSEVRPGEKYTLRITVKDLQASKIKKTASIIARKDLDLNVQ